VDVRRFLLSLGGLLLGTVTAVVTLRFVGSPATAPIAWLGVVWLLSLLAGMILSAPFFVRPPGRVGVWNVRASGVVRVLLLVVRSVTWLGTMLLWGFWELIFLAWDPRKGRTTTGS
jgi:hypothetical protein